jgi:hypothetical protein
LSGEPFLNTYNSIEMITYRSNSALKTVRRFILSLSIVLLFMISIKGQQSQEDRKIELGIGITDFGRFMGYNNNMLGNYQLSTFYRISPSFSLGIQGAYAGFKMNNHAIGAENTTIYAHVISYNLAGKVYFTSLFSERDDRKLHIYAKGKVGAFTYIPVFEEVLVEGTDFDYGLYLGVEYTPFQRVGAFLELGNGNKTYSQFGILFRF